MTNGETTRPIPTRTSHPERPSRSSWSAKVGPAGADSGVATAKAIGGAIAPPGVSGSSTAGSAGVSPHAGQTEPAAGSSDAHSGHCMAILQDLVFLRKCAPRAMDCQKRGISTQKAFAWEPVFDASARRRGGSIRLWSSLRKPGLRPCFNEREGAPKIVLRRAPFRGQSPALLFVGFVHRSAGLAGDSLDEVQAVGLAPTGDIVPTLGDGQG